MVCSCLAFQGAISDVALLHGLENASVVDLV